MGGYVSERKGSKVQKSAKALDTWKISSWDHFGFPEMYHLFGHCLEANQADLIWMA